MNSNCRFSLLRTVFNGYISGFATVSPKLPEIGLITRVLSARNYILRDSAIFECLVETAHWRKQPQILVTSLQSANPGWMRTYPRRTIHQRGIHSLFN